MKRSRKMQFPHLFSPITVNSMVIKNRIVMTAMHLGYTPTGEVSDRLVAFYRERARGGVGLIIVGGCPIDEYGGMLGMIGLFDDRFIPGLERLTTAVKAEGGKIAAQLYQAGRYTHSAMIGGKTPISASAVRSKLTGETPRALELSEIPQVQGSFAAAALRAKKAGFDAVEVLGSAGYLISQFFSLVTNKREDIYGGSLENRMRFGIEVVQKVREAVGPDYPVLMRLAGNEFMPGGNENKEARIFAAELEKSGVDLFDITGGWHETRIPQLSTFVPRKGLVYLAQGIKSAVSVPVIASNRINDPTVAEQIIRRGESDMVTIARGLIADPYLPKKAAEGREKEILHCLACNQGCFDSIFRMRSVTCMVNPRAGLEEDMETEAPSRRKRILVVGGGPAGMKAACTAAERGHHVTLAEKSEKLGGQILLNRVIPGREEIVSLARDLSNNLKALGVNVVLGREADPGFIKDMNPDALVIATGAVPIVPDIPGMNGGNVFQAWDVLSEKAAVGRNVAIVGGNAVGLETALFLASQGTISPETLHFLVANKAESWETIEELISKGNKEVTVIEMTKKAGQDIGASTRWTVLAEAGRLGVKIITGARVVEITESGVKIEKEEGSDFLPADSVVIAAGSKSVETLSAAMAGVVPEIHTIGDAVQPRNGLEAIKEGFLVGLKI
jgi:2,4-dienoyl-CoA reductase (NADPH2)